MLTMETIAEELGKCLPVHDSLEIGDHARADSKGRKLFYTVRYPEQIENMCRCLQGEEDRNSGAFKDILPMIKYDDLGQPKSVTLKDLLVSLTERTDTSVSLDFFPIDTIEFINVSSRFIARVVPGKSLFSILVLTNSGWIFRVKPEGTKNICFGEWWINMLCLNPVFREMMVTMLDLIGTHTKRFILKDIARAIREDYFFLPRIDFSDLHEIHTPKQLMDKVAPRTDLGINYNRVSINTGFYLNSIAYAIDEADRPRLREIPPSMIRYLVNDQDLNEGVPDILSFISGYYRLKLDVDPQSAFEVSSLAEDYARLCLDLEVGIRISLKSMGALQKAHDELVRLRKRKDYEEEFAIPLLPENSGYLALEDMLPDEFELIKTRERLYEEGETMHNCVFSYRHKIHRGECGIFHWDKPGGPSYTIEVIYTESKFIVVQMRQTCNYPAELEDRIYVEALLDENSFFLGLTGYLSNEEDFGMDVQIE